MGFDFSSQQVKSIIIIDATMKVVSEERVSFDIDLS
jgi:hypothetical protein